MINGQMNELSMYSEQLQQEVPLLIYMPDAYVPMQTYNLIIASDGKDYFQYGRIGKVVQSLMDREELDDTIVVGIPYENKYIRRDWYHPDGADQERYVRFIGEELLPFLHERFSLEDDRDSRLLIGDSLAATVSLTILQRYVETFSKVVLHSPLVNEEVLALTRQLDTSFDIAIYHIIGTEETTVQTTSDGIQDFLTPNRALHDVLRQMDVHYFYEEFEGNHTWKYWQRDVERALCKTYQLDL